MDFGSFYYYSAMIKKKSKMSTESAEEFESWQPSRRGRIGSTPSPGTEHGRNDSPVRALIQEQSTVNTENLSNGTETIVPNLTSSSITKDSSERDIPSEDIPLEVLGPSPKLSSVHEGRPVIHYRRKASEDPSMTLDSIGTMNTSIYSTGSNTFTGTLKRGKKDQIVEIQLQLTPAEIDKLNRSTLSETLDNDTKTVCSKTFGAHILVLSVLYLPVALLSSLLMNMYICTMCWYNIYLCLSEERTIWHKIFFCPLLIIFFPLIIILIPVGVALYAAFRQLSCSFPRWLREIKNFEKGFYGWLCQVLRVPECAPYEVIILDENGDAAVMYQSTPSSPV